MRIDFKNALATDADREAFADTFYSYHCPIDDRHENPYPWGCPWLWAGSIDVEGETIKEWAESWWKQNEEEIMRFAREEDEA